MTRKKKDIVRVKAVGNSLELLALLTAASRSVAGRVAEEKEISLEKAEDVVIDCIKDGIKTVKNIR